jgi:predicted anti-sigma-YlaC factor YlaD
MRCEDCREAISARLDGEELPDGAPGADADAAVDRHLDGCAECRDFAERAAYVTRLARIRPAEPTPDLLPGILAALDADRADSSSEDEPVRHPEQQGRVTGARRAWALGGVRIALGLLGIGQVGLAVTGILAATATAAGPSHGSSLAGATMVHFSHESAAWNFAIGVAFLWAAGAVPRPGSGLVPVIGAFTGLLAVLSVTDLLAGRVDATRLAGHLVVVAGLLLLLLHRRLSHHGDGDRQTGSPADPDLHRLRTGSFDGLPLGRRGRRDDGGLQPAGHRRAA